MLLLIPVLFFFSSVIEGNVNVCTDVQIDLIQRIEGGKECIANSAVLQAALSSVRKNFGPVRLEIHAHSESQQTATIIASILMREAMGYSVSLTCSKDGVGSADRMVEGMTDVVLGYSIKDFPQDNAEFVKDTQKVSNFGLVGYTERFGLHVPGYTSTLFSNLDIEYWRTFTDDQVIALYAGQNDTNLIDDSGLNLVGKYTPDWCSEWLPDGTYNTCMDVKSLSSDITSQTELQERIENLGLNITVSYWNVEDLNMYVHQKFNRLEPIAFYTSSPSKIIQVVNATRILFPEDALPSQSDESQKIAVKVVRSSIFTKSPIDQAISGDLKRFLRFFELDGHLFEMANYGDTSYESACTWLQSNEDVWYEWISNNVHIERQALPESFQNVLLSLSILGLIITSFFAIVTMIHRRHTMIRATSVSFSLLTIIGSMFAILDALLLALEPIFSPSSATCATRIWLPMTGLTIALSAMSAKNYRIGRIFDIQTKKSRRRVSVIKISDAWLGRRAFIPVIIVFIVLILQTIIAPSEAQDYFTSHGENSATVRAYCENDDTFLILLYVYIGMLLFGTMRLTWTSRGAPKKFSEAHHHALGLNILLIAIVIGAPLSAILIDENRIDDVILVRGLFEALVAPLVITILFFERTFYVLGLLTFKELSVSKITGSTNMDKRFQKRGSWITKQNFTKGSRYEDDRGESKRSPKILASSQRLNAIDGNSWKSKNKNGNKGENMATSQNIKNLLRPPSPHPIQENTSNKATRGRNRAGSSCLSTVGPTQRSEKRGSVVGTQNYDSENSHNSRRKAITAASLKAPNATRQHNVIAHRRAILEKQSLEKKMNEQASNVRVPANSPVHEKSLPPSRATSPTNDTYGNVEGIMNHNIVPPLMPGTARPRVRITYPMKDTKEDIREVVHMEAQKMNYASSPYPVNSPPSELGRDLLTLMQINLAPAATGDFEREAASDGPSPPMNPKPPAPPTPPPSSRTYRRRRTSFSQSEEARRCRRLQNENAPGKSRPIARSASVSSFRKYHEGNGQLPNMGLNPTFMVHEGDKKTAELPTLSPTRSSSNVRNRGSRSPSCPGTLRPKFTFAPRSTPCNRPKNRSVSPPRARQKDQKRKHQRARIQSTISPISSDSTPPKPRPKQRRRPQHTTISPLSSDSSPSYARAFPVGFSGHSRPSLKGPSVSRISTGGLSYSQASVGISNSRMSSTGMLPKQNGDSYAQLMRSTDLLIHNSSR